MLNPGFDAEHQIKLDLVEVVVDFDFVVDLELSPFQGHYFRNQIVADCSLFVVDFVVVVAAVVKTVAGRSFVAPVGTVIVLAIAAAWWFVAAEVNVDTVAVGFLIIAVDAVGAVGVVVDDVAAAFVVVLFVDDDPDVVGESIELRNCLKLLAVAGREIDADRNLGPGTDVVGGQVDVVAVADVDAADADAEVDAVGNIPVADSAIAAG
uniref:Uncharacterized protein n=1 Tax=Tetranychus urticae TaxID=32264 RepID=T1L2C0_TETUR